MLIKATYQEAWNNHVNLDDKETEKRSKDTRKALAKYVKESWRNHITKYKYSQFKDKKLKRRFEILSVLETPALSQARFSEFVDIRSHMTKIYGTGKVCPLDYRDCNKEKDGLDLEPGLTLIMSNPMNHTYEELEYVWEGWRKSTGRVIRESYKKFIDLFNEAGVANNFEDGSGLWLYKYNRDDEEFQKDLESIWNQFIPLYKKIHGYARYKLREYWGKDKFGARDPIPAHILGDMWAQQWSNTLPILIPYKDIPNPLAEVNEALKDLEYDAKKMFDLSNSFFKKLGFEDMKMCYDTKCGLENTTQNKECFKSSPLINKPDWNVMCHASAWNLDDSTDDYRIKMCTNVDLKDLVTIHHEMGHIQYYIQYKHQPREFKTGANPGFHEAIGDTLALAVQTSDHLHSIGLLKNIKDSYESDINYLFQTALEKIVFLPFAFTVDQYRWALFNGTFGKDEMNFRWWELRERYQGINPPVKRSEEDMDAGSKAHVASHYSYIRYFVSFVMQFQFYRELCIDSGQYNPNNTFSSKPLYKCDFSIGKSAKLAAQRLIRTLKVGASEPWPDVLKLMTGRTKMNADVILEYFQPLEKWLDNIIKQHQIPLGWDSKFQTFFPTTEPSD